MDLDQLLAPLQLIEAHGGAIAGRTRVQKLMFLVQEEGTGSKPFNYIAYDYGPYSKDLQNSLNTLVDLGLLEEKPGSGRSDSTYYTYQITAPGKQFIAASKTAEATKRGVTMKAIQDQWRRKTTDELIHYVYEKFPAYAANSKLQLRS